MIPEHQLSRLRDTNPQKVAEYLGLAEANQRHKCECPFCPSSDAFHVNPPGTYAPEPGGNGKPAATCFSAGCGETCADTIAMVQKIAGYEFAEAAQWLGDRFGIDVDTDANPDAADTKDAQAEGESPTDDKTLPSEAEHRAALAWYDRLERAYIALGEIWSELELDGPGAEYLSGRGLPIDETTNACVRSVSRREWRDLLAAYDEQTLRDAGLSTYYLRPDWNSGDDRQPLEHALVFAYLDADGRVDTLRVREAEPGADVQGLKSTDLDMGSARPGLAPHTPSDLYLAPSAVGIAESRGIEYVLVTEGEIDALSAFCCNRPAAAAPGGFFRTEWWDRFESVPVIAVAGDNDSPGEDFTDRAKRRAAKAFGEQWADTRIGRVQWQGGDGRGANDANDLLQQERLRDELQRLERNWNLNMHKSRRPESIRPAAE